VKLTVSGLARLFMVEEDAAALASTLGKIAPPARSGECLDALGEAVLPTPKPTPMPRAPEAGRLDRDGDDAAGRPFGEAFRTHAALRPRSTWRAR